MAHLIDHMTRVPSVSVFAKARKALKDHALHRKDRRTYGHMLRMTNRELADIGLTRADVREAMANTFSHPGAH